MSKIIKGTLTLGIGFANAKKEDTFEIEVADDASEDFIEAAIQEVWG